MADSIQAIVTLKHIQPAGLTDPAIKTSQWASWHRGNAVPENNTLLGSAHWHRLVPFLLLWLRTDFCRFTARKPLIPPKTALSVPGAGRPGTAGHLFGTGAAQAFSRQTRMTRSLSPFHFSDLSSLPFYVNEVVQKASEEQGSRSGENSKADP